MSLAVHQRKLAGLIRGTYSPGPDDDAYLWRIAESRNLEVTREVVLWWRQLSLERSCPLTSVALKQLGIFDAETEHFVSKWQFSPFVEELSAQFLGMLECHELALVASLARFERALIAVKLGGLDAERVEWSHDPCAVLDAVLNGGDVRAVQPSGRFETIVSASLPGLFEVSEVSEESTLDTRPR